MLDYVVCFRGLVSSPVKGISNNLLESSLHRGATKFIFDDWIVTQEFSKRNPPDRNNFVTSVSYFLQPRMGLLIPIYFLHCCRWTYNDWGHIDTHAENIEDNRRLPSSPHSTRLISHLVPKTIEPPFHFLHE